MSHEFIFFKLFKNQAYDLAGKTKHLETAILTEFWCSVLDRFNEISRSLQNRNVNVTRNYSIKRSDVIDIILH